MALAVALQAVGPTWVVGCVQLVALQRHLPCTEACPQQDTPLPTCMLPGVVAACAHGARVAVCWELALSVLLHLLIALQHNRACETGCTCGHCNQVFMHSLWLLCKGCCHASLLQNRALLAVLAAVDCNTRSHDHWVWCCSNPVHAACTFLLNMSMPLT